VEEPANLQSTSKEGGKRIPNQQLGGEESTKKGYTSEKENKTGKRGAGEPQAKKQEESAIL
jgi:hypothetical protein